MTEQAEIDRISWLLFNTWQKVDPNSSVAKHPVSYMANFADMARAVIADCRARSALSAVPHSGDAGGADDPRS